MTIDIKCVDCIINQSLKVANAIEADRKLKDELLQTVIKMSNDFSFSLTPPEIASDVYKQMALIANRYDLYKKQKDEATKHALSFIPFLKNKLTNSKNRLLTAIKIAIAGNVIDLASQIEFDLTTEIDKIFNTKLLYDDSIKLEIELKKASKIVILGDNTGEHVFDYLFIETLKELYPHLNIFYFVRGTPIINDVTIKEAKEVGFSKICNLIDSGVNTPGFIYNRATKEAKELFDSADIVISKGMGNYESLTPTHRKNICFLLKIKCDVVANYISGNIGDIVCKLI